MNDYIASACCVRENRVRLDDLLREAVVEPLEQKRSESRSGATSNRVEHHEALERVATIRFAVNHFHDVLVDALASLVAITPIVRRPSAVLADVKVLRVINVLVGARLNAVEHSRLEVDQNRPRDVARVIALVVEDVLTIAAFGCEVLKISVLANSVFLTELLPELTANYVRSAEGREDGLAGQAYCYCRIGLPGL
jgi:hypothetical protein